MAYAIREDKLPHFSVSGIEEIEAGRVQKIYMGAKEGHTEKKWKIASGKPRMKLGCGVVPVGSLEGQPDGGHAVAEVRKRSEATP
jgi:hypothetical protein